MGGRSVSFWLLDFAAAIDTQIRIFMGGPNSLSDRNPAKTHVLRIPAQSRLNNEVLFQGN
jgi:hypothetical protein